MAKILAVGVYIADRPNTAAHITYNLAQSANHSVDIRWTALAPGGCGRFDLAKTEMVVTEAISRFALFNDLIQDARCYDWLICCDDDIEMTSGFVDTLIGRSERHDFALSQPARTPDSFIDYPIVQVLPGIAARRTRFVETGPLTCIRNDAMPLLIPFEEDCVMNSGLEFIWPERLERAGLRLGIVDAAPVAQRIRPSALRYDYRGANQTMSWMLARHPHLTMDEAFTVLEVFT